MKLLRTQEEVDGTNRKDFGKLYVEHATIDDAEYIAGRLRDADRREISAVTRESPVRVLVDGVIYSDPCYVIKTRRGRPCGIFGTRDSEHPESGVVWLLGTNDLTAESRTFIRNSKQILNELHEKYKTLFNVIDARNAVHLRWLKWMGFELVKTIPKYGVEQRTFILFTKHVCPSLNDTCPRK